MYFSNTNVKGETIINKNELRAACISNHIVKKPILKVVKEKCLDCCCGQTLSVIECSCTTCSLWPYRFGSNPFSEKNMSEEQRKAVSERFKKYRDNNKGEN